MDWHPLCDSDPFPGDPTAVKNAATNLGNIAAAFSEQATALAKYLSADSSWSGAAHDAFAQKASNLPPQLSQAHDRYDTASSALSQFALALEDHRTKAEALRKQAVEAQHQIDVAKGNLGEQRAWEKAEAHRADLAKSDPSMGSPVAAAWPGRNNAVALKDAQNSLAGLKTQLTNLHTSFDIAAAAAASKLHDAAQIQRDTGGIKGWFEHRKADIGRAAKAVNNWVKDHAEILKVLSEAMSKVSAVLGLLALIPIPGMQFLGGIAMVLSLATLAIDTALMLAGEKTFSSWAIGAAITLLPFAAKGVSAVAAARSASREVALAGKSASTVAKEIDATSDIVSKMKLVGQAESVEAQVRAASNWNKVRGAFGLAPTAQLEGVKLVKPVVGGTRVLTGAAAANTATKVIDLTNTSDLRYVPMIVTKLSKGAGTASDVREVATMFVGGDESTSDGDDHAE